ncbi:MAG: hypothetical protein U0871_24285 [Gemmataceae bacterium]
MKIGSTAKATPTPGGGKRKMTAQELTAELVPGVLDLCLSGTPITVDSIKEVRPTLAAVYTERYSTIPTYLGCGRSGDGLGLHRLRGGGVYQPSFENADLAIAAGRRLGWSDDQIAATVGLTWAELEKQVEDLPMQETFFVAPPPAAPKAAPKPSVSPPAAERRKAEKEVMLAQKQAEIAEVMAGHFSTQPTESVSDELLAMTADD